MRLGGTAGCATPLVQGSSAAMGIHLAAVEMLLPGHAAGAGPRPAGAGTEAAGRGGRAGRGLPLGTG